MTSSVRCEGVWKMFTRGEHHDSLRDLIPALLRRARSKPEITEGLSRKSFWALQDITFTVAPGEALGIIGPNGAGKSTMLKLLTRILRPSRGAIHVEGRQGSLIEVAAGFHGDLTGRENVFLQGAIMGMPLPDIRRKFDQIVEFSGVADFIDTPVKRYSSGMNARLGFAIAAHLDPDVLFIDEVLSVGDLAFQQRAFGRIHEMVKSGIPVVVVSHQLDRISQLCTHAILLEHGRVVKQGTPGECIAEYLSAAREGSVSASDAPSTIERATLVTGSTVRSGERVGLRISGTVVPEGAPPHIDPLVIVVQNASTGAVTSAIQSLQSQIALAPGVFSVDVSLQMNVPRGIYLLRAGSWNLRSETLLSAGPALTLHVEEGPSFYGPVQLNCTMTPTAPHVSDTGASRG